MAAGSSSLQEGQQGESTKGILFESTEYRLGTCWGAETLCKTDLYQLLLIKLAVRRSLWVSPEGGCILKNSEPMVITDFSWAFPVLLPGKSVSSYVNGWFFSFPRERAGVHDMESCHTCWEYLTQRPVPAPTLPTTST